MPPCLRASCAGGFLFCPCAQVWHAQVRGYETHALYPCVRTHARAAQPGDLHRRSYLGVRWQRLAERQVAKALALALLLPACNMAGLVVVQAAPDVGVLASPELRPYCEAAIGRWEHATGISMSCTEGRPLIRGTPSDPCAAASTRFSKVVVRDAQSAEDCTRAGVQDTYPDTSAELATAVAHELGHVLAGQRHNQHADDGLMSPAPELGARITTASLAFVCETAPCTKFEPEAE